MGGRILNTLMRFNFFMTEALVIEKPVHLFAEQYIMETSVMNQLIV